MNNIGPSATSRAAASYSAAYSYLGHRWMTTFRSAEDVKTSLAMIRGYSREMGHELKARTSTPPYINVKEDRDGAFAESKQFLDSYYSVDYRQDMLRLWVSGDATVIQVQSTYIPAPAPLGMMPSPAWAIDCFNSRAWRLMFAIVSMAASAGLSITSCLPSTAIAARLRSLV
jgi:hypothetical protein